MAVKPTQIPRSAYTSPLTINTRQTKLTVCFDPQENTGKDLRSPVFSNTIVIDSTEGEIPFFKFEMRDAKRNRESVKIRLDYNSFLSFMHLADDEESGSWTKTAAEVRYYAELHELERKYESESADTENTSAYSNPLFHSELKQLERRRSTMQGIADSEEPLKLMHYTIDDWENTDPNRTTAGATMTVFYQPKVKGGEPCKKPWIIEIAKYQLQYSNDGTTARKSEVRRSIVLKSEEINTLINKLNCDHLLWKGYEKAVNSYLADPKKFSSLFT